MLMHGNILKYGQRLTHSWDSKYHDDGIEGQRRGPEGQFCPLTLYYYNNIAIKSTNLWVFHNSFATNIDMLEDI